VLAENPFDTRRQEITVIAARFKEVHRYLCPSLAGVSDQLVAAEEILQESAVVLCIVGAEGAGKSSLVDSILKADVVPTESGKAGTIAPTLIRWGSSEQPTYHVLMNGSEEPILCQDREQFRRFILQRFNPENEQGVALGLVEMNNPLLADGLRLFDLPGVDGLSQKIDLGTREALKEAHAVLVVVKDRTGFSSALKLVAQLRAQGAKVQAFVNNLSFEAWQDRPDELVRDCTAAARENLAEVGFDLPENRIFILHLPSIENLQISSKAWVTHRRHKAEIDRFRLWLSRQLDAARVSRIMLAAIEALLRVGGELQSRIDVQQKFLDELGRRGGSPNASALAQLAVARAEFARGWDGILDNPVIADMLRRNIGVLKDRLRTQAEASRQHLETVGQWLGSRDGWTTATANEAARRLRAAFDECVREIETSHSDAVHALLQEMRAEADPAALQLVDVVPCFLGPLDAVRVEGSYIVNIDHTDPDQIGFLEIFNSARTVDRILEGYKAAANAFSAGDQGEPITTFRTNIDNVRRVFNQAFDKRVTDLERFISRPDAELLERQ
jgi:hypothetical protein